MKRIFFEKMEICRTYESVFDFIECDYDENNNNRKVPKVVQAFQRKIYALKLSGCKIANFKSVFNFFRKRLLKKKSPKKQGYCYMLSDEEKRYSTIENQTFQDIFVLNISVKCSNEFNLFDKNVWKVSTNLILFDIQTGGWMNMPAVTLMPSG